MDKMKQKIIIGIDCGKKTCMTSLNGNGCILHHQSSGNSDMCFPSKCNLVRRDLRENPHGWDLRRPECLAAEQAYNALLAKVAEGEKAKEQRDKAIEFLKRCRDRLPDAACRYTAEPLIPELDDFLKEVNA